MAKKKAIFLDRDGVINQALTERVKFVNKPEDIYCDMNHKFARTASLWFFLFAANLCFQDLKNIFNVAFK
ncbi:hypothetical protein DX932_10035 [Bacillus cereus]|uniref:D,D-heptose 1,7-bisphosphate phosphatase n=1 Tax=Bacillus cereus TaxID=1396 RepID=A0A9W7Q750_BACCE|nr:hypothetical protein [Bacillus cereus]KAA6470168.1 hypothetical protein DX932_10035 [Bacillus cereus]